MLLETCDFIGCLRLVLIIILYWLLLIITRIDYYTKTRSFQINLLHVEFSSLIASIRATFSFPHSVPLTW